MFSERVTVIVPTYQHQDYLRYSVISILNQTIPIKLIVVPVASDVPTIQALGHLSQILSQFDRTFTTLEADKPDVFGQMQLGIDHVDTEYFFFLGSDDIALPHMAEKMLSKADDLGVANPIVGMSCAKADETFNITSLSRAKPFKEGNMRKGSYIPDNALVKLESVQKVGALIRSGVDWGYANHYAMYLRLLRLEGTEVYLFPEIGWIYRELPNSRHIQRYKTRADLRNHRKLMREVWDYYNRH